MTSRRMTSRRTARRLVTSAAALVLAFAWASANLPPLATASPAAAAAPATAAPVNLTVEHLPEPVDVENLTAPLLGHFGDRDTTPAPDEVRRLADRITAESGRRPDFRFHPADHAFFNDENPLGTYDPAVARRAWDTTVEFLRANLG